MGRLRFALFMLALLFVQTNKGQSEWVRTKVFRATPLREFRYHTPSKFQKVNGKVGVAISSSNGFTFQIKGIPANGFQCGTVLGPDKFDLVLIDESMGITYVSQKSDYHNSIGIICLEQGLYRLKVKGKIFGPGRIKVSIQATLQGQITSDKQFRTTSYDAN